MNFSPEPFFTCVIPGRPFVKKNNQKVVGKGRSRRKINTPQYEAWVKKAKAIVSKHQHQVGGSPYAGHVHAVFTYYFENRMAEPDLSNLHEGIQDVLADCGIILNDRRIESHDGSRKRFYQEPRLEVTLLPYMEPIDEKPK